MVKCWYLQLEAIQLIKKQILQITTARSGRKLPVISNIGRIIIIYEETFSKKLRFKLFIQNYLLKIVD
jgi:hypothetical protein